MRPNSSNILRSALLAAAALFSLSQHASAQSNTWDGGGADDNFSTAANWLNDVAVTSVGTWTFDGTTRLTPVNTVPFSSTADSTLNFATGAGSFTITGNNIRFGAINNNSSVLQTVALGLRLNGTRGINSGSGGVRLTGSVASTGTARTLNKTGSSDLEYTFSGTTTNINHSVNAGRLVLNNASGTLTIPTVAVATGTELVSTNGGTSATVVNGVSGAGSVRKSGSGSSTLGGTVSYTGNTVVESGVLTYGGAFAANSASTTTLTLKGAATPVAGTDFGQILASNATYTYGGQLSLSFADAAVPGSTYNLFDTFGSGSVVGSLLGVSLTGNYAGSLVDSGAGVWTGLIGGLNFTFTSTTGDLFVAIPEPATCAAFAGVLALGFIASRRRKA